ncbi:beta strand repeat-containing protein [Thioclava pacifica]|uniref:Autotransporter domain-containing protein n=1 Tax=Thioclava pacifica DSM 10166 TaxID=1353537 RepID=A0A074JN61_9RHOB|nr:autotransporter-associated beta strand repeat-containing protein [Thioclava pacifica]KEO50817.1 hypothetical protein TP2_14410 [Thioclava pacifica DSM 10166]
MGNEPRWSVRVTQDILKSRKTLLWGTSALLLALNFLSGEVYAAQVGGTGGNGGYGGAGGSPDLTTGTATDGGNGTRFINIGTGGGGGSAGITGGAGGSGGTSMSAGGGAGGAGGAAAVGGVGGDGSNGSNGGASSGGGGGGGGAFGAVSTTFPLAGPVQGGNGGRGGNSNGIGGGGGGGGGGFGVFIMGAGGTNTTSITGGAGGNGGNSSTYKGGDLPGGNGGAGGAGVVFAGTGSLANSGTIQGGNGGTGGTGGTYHGSSQPGAGGVGVAGSGLTIVNNGSISGGLSGDGVTRADAINFTGGANTLTEGATGTLTGNIGINGGGSLLIDQTGNSATLSNAITGNGSVEIRTGSNALTLNGASTYRGGTTLTNGTVFVGSDKALGTGGVTITGGSALIGTGSVSLGNAINVASGQTGIIGAVTGSELALSGAINLSGANLHIGVSNGLGTADGTVVTAFSSLTSDASSSISVDYGTLQIGATDGGGTKFDLPVTVVGSGAASATLDVNGHAVTFAGLSGNANGVITNGGTTNVTLTVDDSAGSTFGGTINDGTAQIALTKTGAGNFVLAGANGYTGLTTVSGGSLTLGNAAAIGNQFVVDGSGSVMDLGGYSVTVVSGTVQGSGTLQNGTLEMTANSATALQLGDALVAANLTGAGAGVTAFSGTSILTGTNTYGGGTTIGSGATLIAGNGSALGTGGVSIGDGATLVGDGTFTLSNGMTVGSGNSGTIAATNGNTVTLTGAASFDGAAVHIGTATSAGTVVGAFSGVSGTPTLLSVDYGTFRMGAGTTDLPATNLGAAGTLDVNGNSTTFAALSGDAGGVLTNGTASNVALTVAGGTTSFAGCIEDGSGGGITALEVAGADLTMSGANTYTGGTTVTSGGLAIAAGGSIAGPLEVSGGNVSNAGAIGGTLSVAGGTVTNSGVVSGATSISGGTVTLASGSNLSDSAGVTLTGGTLFVDAADATGALTNGGTVSVGSTGNLTVNGDVTNTVGGTINIATGGTLTDALNNSGTVNNAGTYNADVNNYATGVITNSGTWNGDLLSNAGFVSNTGTWNGNVVSNSSTISLGNGSTITGNVASSGGTLALETGASATIGGDLNGGTISMQNGAATEALAVSGTTSGPLTVNLDVDLTTGTADSLSLNGGTGAVAMNYNLIGSPTLGTPITVISGTNLDQLSYTATGLSSGAIVASQEVTPTAVSVVAQVNPSLGGTITGLTVVQSLMGVVIDRPAPIFDAQPEGAGQCSGAWARAVGGYAKGTASTSNGISNQPSQTRVHYNGLQVGGDWGCGESDGGMALRWGAMAGINNGSTAQGVYGLNATDPTVLTSTLTSTTRSDFSQSYAGVYLAGQQGGFGFNLQLRKVHSDFDLSDPSFFAPGTSTALNTTTLAGDVSFTQSFSRGLSVTSLLGLGLSRTGSSSLSYLNGTLVTQAHDGRVAFVGATLRKVYAVNGEAAKITSFATGKVYHDFSPDIVSTFAPTGGGTSSEVRSGNLGTYGEVSLGVNYVKPLTFGGTSPAGQLGAALGLTGQFSDKVHSVGLRAQLRVQF